jgi:hypothetical protein
MSATPRPGVGEHAVSFADYGHHLEVLEACYEGH